MYDVVLIHPPTIYDFRKKTFFPGPIAYTVRESSDQFIIPPIGMFSIAEFLERNGYKVLIDNLGDRMLYDRSFDVEQHLRKIDTTVYGVRLNWSMHLQGALEVARLCKALHPQFDCRVRRVDRHGLPYRNCPKVQLRRCRDKRGGGEAFPRLLKCLREA